PGAFGGRPWHLTPHVPGAPWPPSAPAATDRTRARVNGHPAITAVPGHTEQPSVDYAAVRVLRQRVSEQLTTLLRDSTNVSTQHRQAEGERIAARVVREYADTLMHAGTPVS